MDELENKSEFEESSKNNNPVSQPDTDSSNTDKKSPNTGKSNRSQNRNPSKRRRRPNQRNPKNQQNQNSNQNGKQSLAVNNGEIKNNQRVDNKQRNQNNQRNNNTPWGMNPLPTQTGIQTRSQRGEFAKNWWARRWLEALERLMQGVRLSRGQYYARIGQIVSLEEIKGGMLARVQGSRPKPYRVTIQLTPFNNKQWEKVLDLLSEKSKMIAYEDEVNVSEESMIISGAPSPLRFCVETVENSLRGTVFPSIIW